jgi:alpha-glucosidase
MAILQRVVCASLAVASVVTAGIIARQANGSIDSCPGYKASNVKTSSKGLTASLQLAGPACNAYGTDLTDLTLTVEYQSSK